MATHDRALKVFIVVAEESGDQLGARLMSSLRELWRGDVLFAGTGGSRMEAAGLDPMLRPGEVDVIGFGGLFSRLPEILRRIGEVAMAAIAFNPDVIVLIDSPEFSHRVARKARRQLPSTPVVNYVPPSVWAWRSGRAKRMVRYIDQVLALLPFEPAVYEQLGGPPCTYVGHPLVEKLSVLRPAPGERASLEEVDRPTLLMLPGSRRAEVRHLMPVLGKTLELVTRRHGPVNAILPAVGHLAEDVRQRMDKWQVGAHVVVGEDAKFAAFRSAHAAVAASGTVSLELALSGIPSVITYKVDALLRPLGWSIQVPSVVLANVILRDRVMPELLNRRSDPERLASAVLPLLQQGEARQKQIDAFRRLDGLMALDQDIPSRRAASLIIGLLEERVS